MAKTPFRHQGFDYFVDETGRITDPDGRMPNPGDTALEAAAAAASAGASGATPPAPSAPAPTSYDRSIKTAAATLAAANADWERVNALMAAIPETERSAGGTRETEYASLAKQLDAAAKRSGTAEAAYQDAVEASDKAAADAKTFAPKGEKRQRLDTTSGNVLVAVTEIADGRGGWSNDPQTPPAKVDIPGVTPKAGTSTITAAPSSEWILKDGVLEKNPAFTPPRAATPTGAVPTSEYVYDADGKPIKNVAFVPPKSPNEGLTTGGRAQDEAVGRNAGAMSDTALATAQTNQQTAELALADAQRRARQSPTDEQAQLAIATAQKALELANKGLEDAQAQTAAEGPGRLAQQGATLEQTQAATDASREATAKGKQGDLYGLPDRIKQIRDLIASGEIKPADADASLAAVQRGTDIYTVMKEQAADKEKARTQDITSKNALAGNFASTFNSANNTFQEMNKTGAIGSDATGKAFLATLGLAQDYLKSYEPTAATPTDYLGGQPTAVGGMVNQAQQQLAAVPPPAVVPPPQAAAPAPIVVNVNAGGGTSPSLLPAGDTGTQRDPMVANSPAQPQPAYMNGAGPGPVNPGGGGVSSLVGAASRAVPAGVADVEADHQAALQRLHGLTGGM